LVKGFGKICKTQGQFLVKGMTLKQCGLVKES